MKYLLKTIRIYENKNERGIYNWMRAELFIEGNPWANPGQLPVMYNTTQEVVDIYKPFATVRPESVDGDYKEYDVDTAKMKAKIDSGELPDYLHVDHVAKCVEDLPEQWVRVYKNDTSDGHAKGEWIMGRNGEPQVISRLVFYLAQYYDPDENKWELVEDPKQVAQRTLERGYKRYTPVKSGGTAVETMNEPERPTLTEGEKEAKMAELKAQMEALGLGN